MPELDCSPISYGLRNFAALPIAASELRCYAEFYVGKIPRIRNWRRAARASRGFKMVLFTEPSEDLCRR